MTEDQYRLMYAAYYNDIKMMISLHVRGWKVNAYDYDGRTALNVAASEGNLEATRYLLMHGASLLH